jgi:sugar lactone lactonase YvrE
MFLKNHWYAIAWDLIIHAVSVNRLEGTRKSKLQWRRFATSNGCCGAPDGTSMYMTHYARLSCFPRRL